MRKEIQQQIIHLLNRVHSPRVQVADSIITTAGRGVFSNQTISTNELPMVMCLYPGVYTPGLPIHAMGNAEYLANLSPPSNYGSDIGENAYIMNLQDCGGYIDGCALENQNDHGSCNDLVDTNPSACGHLVNHDAVKGNVEVFSFIWDALTEMDDATLNSTKEDCFSIPNELRADGSPWYYDTMLNELVSFPSKDETSRLRKIKMLCGAALILKSPISQGDELLLDYGLKEPYPMWAKGWYKGAAEVK